jgi:hypothetical protein
MPQHFLAECYWANQSDAALRARTALIAAAADELRSEGRDIALLGSVLVPADEVCFWRFVGTTQAEVELVGRRCGLAFDRVTPSIDLSAPERRS